MRAGCWRSVNVRNGQVECVEIQHHISASSHAISHPLSQFYCHVLSGRWSDDDITILISYNPTARRALKRASKTHSLMPSSRQILSKRPLISSYTQAWPLRAEVWQGVLLQKELNIWVHKLWYLQKTQLQLLQGNNGLWGLGALE